VTPDGRIETVAGTNVAGNGDDSPGPGTQRQLNEPNGLWVRGDGTGYILDRTNEKVRRLSPEGVLTLAFRVPGLRTGRGLWVSEDEQLAYVSSETRLLRWTSSAGIENYTPAAVYKELGNLAVDSDGNVIVTDRKADRVYKVTPARSVVSLAGNGTNSGGGDGFPALETAYEACGSSTHAHAGDGDFFRSPGPKVSAARSVSMDSRGNVLITENDFGYVRIIYRKGTFALP
jgi:streptogramin lyase